MSPDLPFPVLQAATGECFPLQDPTTLGRVQGNDLVLPDAGCSSRHAVIRLERGAWVIEDLGSTNGTWINGDRLDVIRSLQEGDRIQLGAQEFSVHGLPMLPQCVRCGAVPLAKAAFCPTCGLPLGAATPSVTLVMPPPRLSSPGPAPARQSRALGPVLSGVAGAAVLAALLLVFFWPRLSGILKDRRVSQGPAAPSTAVNRAKRPLPPNLDLFHEALLFRQGASNSGLQATIARYDHSNVLDFLTHSKTFQETPAVWAYFFSGTVVLGGHLESPRPLVAYYNPYLDSVLLTQWERSDGQARLVAADLRIASAMAGKDSTDPRVAWWISESGKRPLPMVLKEQYTVFVQAFTHSYPADSRTIVGLETARFATAARPVVERQAMASLINLINLQTPKSPVYSPELAALRQALASGDVPTLAKLLPAGNPMKAEALAAQPAWLRREVVPMYAMAGVERMIVLLAPSRSPRYVLMARWLRKPTPRMEAVLPNDLDGTPLPILKNVAKGAQP